MKYRARFAQLNDVDNVIQFIRNANISVQGVAETIRHFVLLENDSKQIKMTIGIEPIDDIGILRSLVMTNDISQSDLLIMFTKVLLLAKEKQLKQLYLATNYHHAQVFLTILGFKRVNKENLPQKLFRSAHFTQNVENEYVDFMQLNL